MSYARIVFCSCSNARLLPEQDQQEVLDSLQANRANVIVVPDLCGSSARRDPLLKEIVASGPTAIVACYPRAVKWLFAAAGAPLPQGAEIFNLRIKAAKELIAALNLQANVFPGTSSPQPSPPRFALEEREKILSLGNRSGSGVQCATSDLGAISPSAASWQPWFPVIDFDRCTYCMQCLSFCLFGVYGLDERKRIAVLNPESCKPNCPACSRVCPQLAIMFPKHNTGPINGEEITAPEMQRDKAKVDISAMLGGDLYSTLRQRNQGAKTRFSKERDPEQALKERQHWLAQMAASGEIPPEVLASLPSPAELQRRAKDAAENARSARANQGAAEDQSNPASSQPPQ